MGYRLVLAIWLGSLFPVAAADTLRILAIGQVLPGESPLDIWFAADPLIEYVLVPTEMDFTPSLPISDPRKLEQAWQRFIRLYFPKNREALVEGFDFLVFPDGNIMYFTASQIADMKHAIESGAGSFVTMGGGMATVTGYTSVWMSSGLAEVLPLDLTDKMRQDANSGFSIKVVKTDPPVLSMFVPLGIETVVGAYAFTNLYPEQASTLWANLISHGQSLPSDAPGAWLVSWRFGSGLSWVVADDLDSTWWSSVHWPTQNKYAGDVFFNILLYSAGRSLPDNFFIVHDLRGRYINYGQQRAVLVSLLDFIDRFGANTRGIEYQVANMDELKEMSFDAYRTADFGGALGFINEASEGIASISADAVKLKGEALLWVYATEWSAVTGTLFLSGLAVYSLMIRRRVYREAGTTRLRALE